jgi:twinkle protein
MMMAKEISQQLAQQAEDIARHLLPNGKRQSNECCVFA